MRFLLVHGGWQGGWCWTEVAAALEAAGHETFAPTLLGADPDAEVDLAEVDLSAIVAALGAELEELDYRDFIAVGHSGGGPVIQALSERNPDRLAGLVFANAWVLEDGESIYDAFPEELSSQMRAVAAATPDRTIPITAEFWSEMLMSDVPKEESKKWLSRLAPSPEGWMDEVIALPTFPRPGMPLHFIFLEDDKTVPRGTLELFASRLPAVRTTTAPGSHEAMLTRPREFAEALLRVTQR
jgi:pimeloyl-ACP methyl ester carboxylesterase